MSGLFIMGNRFTNLFSEELCSIVFNGKVCMCIKIT